MMARDLYAGFGADPTTRGGIILDESDARSIVDQAESSDVAVVWIEIAPDGRGALPDCPDRLSDFERRESWRDARAFLNDWADRGLQFEVHLESALATRLSRAKRRAKTLIQDNTTSPGPDRHP